jgi:hypothetical protein
MEPSIEGDPLALQESPDDLEAFLEPRGAMVERDPERVELCAVPSRTDGDHEPTTAQLVDGRGGLGEDGGVVEVQTGDERPQEDAFRHGREPCEEGPGFPRASFRAPVVPIEVMVTDPDGVETGVLGGARHRRVLRPPDLAFHLGKLDADAQTSCHAPESMDRGRR